MAVNERRVRFLADYDYKPTPGSTVAYKAGWAGLVRKECADKAVALGKAERMTVTGPPSGIAGTIARRGRRGRKGASDGPPT
jgi:hypothetical protein